MLSIHFQLFGEAVGKREPIPADDVTPTREATHDKGTSSAFYITRFHRLTGPEDVRNGCAMVKVVRNLSGITGTIGM